eukprot:Nitzschia sp. Nitz4//scaffold208_size52459//29175//30961//NITZ4_006814-RA/size52459-processed-gene-0.25-mRNA-1//1//CDS//3329541663//420//frame0
MSYGLLGGSSGDDILYYDDDDRSYARYNETINYAELCPDIEVPRDISDYTYFRIWQNDCVVPPHLGGSDYTNEVSFFEPLSENQQLVCVLLSRIAALLSILGSGYIIYCLLGPRREKELKKRLFSRLLFGLSICDALASLALILGPWPKPSDDPYQDNHSDGSVWLKSLGTQATCNVQGFVLQAFYYASLYYTACLCLNFLFSVNYRWTESQLHTYLERWFHGVSVLLPLVLALLAYFLDMYNPAALNCGLTTSPLGCDADEELDCERGSNLIWWSMGLQFIPVVACFSCIVVCMVLIYRAVRAQEKAVARFRMQEAPARWAATTAPPPSRIASSNSLNDVSASTLDLEIPELQRSRDSRLAFGKAVLYIGVALAVWLPVFVIATCETFDVHIPYAVWVIRSIMTPLVGLLNAIAYSGIISISPKGGVQLLSRIRNSSNSQQDSNGGASSTKANIDASVHRESPPRRGRLRRNLTASLEQSSLSMNTTSGTLRPLPADSSHQVETGQRELNGRLESVQSVEEHNYDTFEAIAPEVQNTPEQIMDSIHMTVPKESNVEDDETVVVDA